MNIQDNSPGGKKNSVDFEINLAPIVDCLTVLITFMLVSASFLSIGVLEAGEAAGGEESTNQGPSHEVIQVELHQNYELVIHLSGQSTQTIRIAGSNGDWDYSKMSLELEKVKQKWPQTENVLLSADDDVEYVHIVKCLEIASKVIPQVIISGF
jgi:biopolymer transport protein TolR